LGDFVSLNSWTAPGVIYQGQGAAEILAGTRSDWPRLRRRLAEYSGIASDRPHPRGAAVGWIGYEGDFWFGFYPELEVFSAETANPRWKERAATHEIAARIGAWKSNQSPASFEQRVQQAQDYIAAGDVYQVNLAQKFSCAFEGNPYRLFEQLLWRSPAPGGAFLDTGERQVLSSSPELFLKIQGRHVTTRPIKGTRPRHPDPLRDEQLAYELMTDPKELAELIMITDLERNDLGQICEYGSVTVTDLMRLERYAQVFHLVSTVEGWLRPEIGAFDALEACFPGGSISGAPKKRACEIISELEPEPRGIYTGAIGYFGFNGDAAFNIAIRTMQLQKGELSFFVGSGITSDSVPRREYEETLHKAAGMRQAVEVYARQAGVAA
jgi:para-aminobenzoate synthetase component 1